MPKPILIVVSTFNRRDLTGITLDSIKRNKSSLSDVLIVDDASTDYDEAWLSRWDFPVVRSETTVGVGKAALRRYQEFLSRDYAYVCTLDNDVLTSSRFDLELLNLFCEVDDNNMTVASGYRSCTQSVYKRKDVGRCVPYWDAVTVNGLSQFTDRQSTLRILKAMGDTWNHPWDAVISKLLTRIVVPDMSLLEHIGIHGSGVNGLSCDVACDFVG